MAIRLRGIAVGIFIIFLFGMLMNVLWESICFFIFIMLLRKFSGGYHANKEWACYLISTIIVLITSFLIKCISNRQIYLMILLFVLFVFSFMIIFIMSPVDSACRRLSNEETVNFRFRARIILFWKQVL